jgi:hypothetical protein
VEKAVAQAILPSHPEIFKQYIAPMVLRGQEIAEQIAKGGPVNDGRHTYPDVGAYVADYHTMNYVPAEVVKAALRDEGFDGVIYNNTSRHEIQNTDQSQRQSYIIFEPQQAQSATGNSEAFDPNNRDIRYRRPAGVFYSELAQQLGQEKASKAPGVQWKAIIVQRLPMPCGNWRNTTQRKSLTARKKPNSPPAEVWRGDEQAD